MITLYRPTHTDPDPFVGQLQVFRQSDFYCKSKQSQQLPESHPFDERLIEAYEFLFQLFSLQFGTKAKPSIASTFRIVGDPNYKTGSGKLSYHSQARAADGNWKDSVVEDYIVSVIAYDIETKGKIYQQLQQIGINGFGTYYREAEGTFLHLDTRDTFVHFRKIRRYKLSDAKRWHREFMTLVYADSILNARINNGVFIADSPRDYSAIEKGKTVLWLTQQNCSICQTAAPLFYTLQENNFDQTINWQGIDLSKGTPSDEAAKTRYQIQSLPTLLFLQDGVEMGRIEKGFAIEKMQASLNQLLQVDPKSWRFKSQSFAQNIKTPIDKNIQKGKGLAQEGAKEIIDLTATSGEDPRRLHYQIIRWVVLLLFLFGLGFLLYHFLIKIPKN